jgi:hypothetical protein
MIFTHQKKTVEEKGEPLRSPFPIYLASVRVTSLPGYLHNQKPAFA